MSAEDPLKPRLRAWQQRVEQALDLRLPSAQISPATLHQAMRYVMLGGGKRFRPVLVYATGEALGLSADPLDGVACAVECIHAYSLVHDDLPAMDDDALRRGQPSCHKAYDEATAILVGDALQSLAFQLLAGDQGITVQPSLRVAMIEHLALASGSRGMVGGQVLDLAAESRKLNLAELESLHIHKTGALIRASVKLAVLVAAPTEQRKIAALDHYAKCVGLAFQVKDDILDIEGDSALLGKTQGKDQRAEKATYPALMGLEESKRFAVELRDDALRAIDAFDQRADPLRWLARYVATRNC